MALPPPIGYALYSQTFTQTASGRTAVVTMGVQPLAGATAAGTLSNVAAALNAANRIFDPATLDSSWSLTEQYCLFNNGGIMQSAQQFVSVAGTVAGNCVTPQVSIVMNKRTARAGRQFRGRTAIPAGFLQETDVDDSGTIGGTRLTAFNLAASLTYSALAGNGVPAYLLHSMPLSGILPTPTPVTSFLVSGLVGTQRKRLRR